MMVFFFKKNVCGSSIFILFYFILFYFFSNPRDSPFRILALHSLCRTALAFVLSPLSSSSDMAFSPSSNSLPSSHSLLPQSGDDCVGRRVIRRESEMIRRMKRMMGGGEGD